MAINALTQQYVQEGTLLGGGGGQFDLFKQDSSPRVKVGTRYITYDGSEYVYSHFGADVNRGVLVAQDASESSLVDTDNAVVAPASAAASPDGSNIAPGTIGSKYIQLTVASITNGQFAGGKLVITDDTGEGFTYDVVTNTATGNPVTGDIFVALKQPLQATLDATTDLAIQGSLYANLEIATAATDICLAGVTMQTMDVSVADYGWIQVKGRVGVLQDGVIAIGDVCSLSDGVAGAIQVAGGGGTTIADLVAEEIVGTCLIAGDTGGHGVFKLNIS